jgi:hypothetical protein
VQFFSRVFGAASKTSRVRRADRSPRSRCAQIGVESLEGRDLKSAGMVNQDGILEITATQNAHNTATVSNDQNGNVVATLNNNSQTFPAGAVWCVIYSGGQGGGDTFINSTGLTEMAVGYGGNNHFVGGSSWNTVELWGNNNFYDARGGPSEVFAYNGPNDQITPYSDVSVVQSTYYGW